MMAWRYASSSGAVLAAAERGKQRSGRERWERRAVCRRKMLWRWS